MKLLEDRGLKNKIKKLGKKKIPDAEERWELTKKTFEEDYQNPILRFKAFQSSPGTFEIRFLAVKGSDGGYRAFLRKAGSDYIAFNVTEHP